MASSSPPAACPILHLPLELMDRIITACITPRDRISLASTCTTISQRYYLPAILSRLQQHLWSTDLPPQLFYLANVVDGSPGFAPFFISSLRLSDDRTRITCGITSPSFNESTDGIPVRSHSFIDVSRGYVANVLPEYFAPLAQIRRLGGPSFATRQVDDHVWHNDTESWFHDALPPKVLRPIDYDIAKNTRRVDWRSVIGGRMRPALVRALSRRFPCSECNNVGHLVVKMADLLRFVPFSPPNFTRTDARGSRRWPELILLGEECESAVGFRIPCPRCKGYDRAVEDCAIQVLEDKERKEQRVEEEEERREKAKIKKAKVKKEEREFKEAKKKGNKKQKRARG